MRVIAVIITKKEKIDPRVIAAIKAQGCELVINKLKPIKLHENPEKDRYMNSVRNRNAMRKRMLKRKDWDKLWMVDDDVIPPEDALKTMLAANLPVVGGWYKMHSGDDWICGQIIEKESRTIYMYTVPRKENTVVDLMGPGCCLIDRKVLEKIEFDAGVDSLTRSARGFPTFEGDSFNFTQKVKALGYHPTMVNVICQHLPPAMKYYKIDQGSFKVIVEALAKHPIENSEILTYAKKLKPPTE